MKNGSFRGQYHINTYSKLWSLTGHFGKRCWIYNAKIWWVWENRREKDAIIVTLQNELKKASVKVEDLEKNWQEGKNSTLGEIAF